MLVGYQTRLMTIVVWAMTASIQVRNPFVLSGPDTLLRVLLFWSILLPLGAWWSVDRLRSGRAARISSRYISVATIELFLQVAFMYWFTAALKSGAPWREDGPALYHALGAGQLTKPLGEYLHQYSGLMQALSFGNMGLEVVAPILLFCPIFTGPIRTVAALSLISFHLGIYLTLDIGIFPWLSAFCMVSFFPTWFWETALPWLRAALPTRVSRLGGSTRRTVAQPAQAIQAFSGHWIGIGRSLVRPLAFGPSLVTSTAVGSAGSFAPGDAADTAVERSPAPDPDRPVRRLRSSPLTNVFAGFCLLFVFGWNMSTVSDYTMPTSSLPIAYGLGLYQKWNMFAPQPPQSTSWYLVRGILQNGRQLDMLSPIIQGDTDLMEPVSWERPSTIAGDLYKDKYWRKYLTQITRPGFRNQRQAFAAYTCRTWNADHSGSEELRGITIVTVVQRTLPDYETTPPQRTAVAQYRCL